MGIRGGEKVKVTSARSHYIAKAMVTRRIKPMMIDGKETFQIGIPIHWGFRGIAEDEGKTAKTLANQLYADGHRSQRIHAGVQGLPGEDRESLEARDPTMSRAATRYKPKRSRAMPDAVAGLRECSAITRSASWSTPPPASAAKPAKWPASSGTTCRSAPRLFDNTYQTMPDTRWNFWNLIKFNEHQRDDGTIQWLMRKDQCMHCADPGCLAACPADGAIVQVHQRHRGFQPGELHRLRVLRVGLPVQHSASSIRRRRKFTSARCARTAWAKGWNRPASRRVRPVACSSAPRTT